LDFNPDRKMSDGISVGDVRISLAEDKHSATLAILREGVSVAQASLNTNDLEQLIAHLGEMRATMPMQTSPEPRMEPGSHELVVVDPAWRTQSSVHSEMDGILIRLRHVGFGWLTFLLPHHEAVSLGNWLFSNAKQGTSE
jgi:hypothetical protein